MSGPKLSLKNLFQHYGVIVAHVGSGVQQCEISLLCYLSEVLQLLFCFRVAQLLQKLRSELFPTLGIVPKSLAQGRARRKLFGPLIQRHIRFPSSSRP